MKLIQMNFLQVLTDQQKQDLKYFMPNEKVHANGIVYIKKLDMEFASYKDMMSFKKKLADSIGIKSNTINMTYDEY